METKRLFIRPLTQQDEDDLHAVLSDAKVMRSIEAPYSREQTSTFIEHVRTAEPMPVYAVVWKESSQVIGQLIYHPFDGESWELGWILHRDFWRRGIADELTAAVMADARERRIPALVIECDKEQSVSRHIAEKHGFQAAGEENGLLLYRRRLDNS